MKPQIFSLLFFLLLIFSFQAQAEKTIKRVYKSFPVSQVSRLELSNKYGNIQIDDNRKDSVIINVEIWVDGSGSRAQKLLDNINVEINSSGGNVSASTDFRNSFNNINQEFGIDYHVSVPADKDLTVAQKYGNVTMNNLTGKGNFDIKYGEFRAQNLLSPALSLDISYSKASIETTKDFNVIIKYSKLSLNKGENLNIDSKYSGLNMGDFREVVLDSKYDDIKFRTINDLKVNSMYTGYKIDKILSNLVLTNGYGEFHVSTIPASFKSIKVSSRYAGIRLGIESGASYKLDGSVRYCELKHPAGKMNRSKEDNSYEVHGNVGDSDSPKSTVSVESSYGNVNLMP